MPWNEILRQYGPMLYRAAYCILQDDGEAEDVVQDVLFEAYRRYRVSECLPEGGLLRRMATLRAIDRLRRRKRPRSIEVVQVWRPGDAPDCELQKAEQAERLRQAIGRLPQRQAECFVLRHVEGMSCEEISEMLGVSLTSVTTSLHKARTRLRTLMGASTKRECQP